MLRELHEARVARRATNPRISAFSFGGNAVSVAEVPGSAIGSIVWEGCHVLSRFLSAHAEVIQGKHVLEIGSGVGLAGLAAASLGASHVVLTDTALLLPLLKENVARNNPGVGSRCVAVELAWGDLGWSEFAAVSAAAAFPLDFDVVLASDVVYREDSAIALVATLAAISERAKSRAPACNPVIYMAYKERGAGAQFFSAAAAAGFTCKELAAPDGEHVMLELRRNESACLL